MIQPFHRNPALLAWALLLACVATFLPLNEARAVDRSFAGSAQLDYHLVPGRNADRGRSVLFDGFTLEAGLKLAVDVSDRFSANVKLCVGCHGLETDMAHLDYRFADELNVRVGRFSPSFGSFNTRHDPANHRFSDKPLAYDMGRMLRLRDWNMGVLPSPFPDNGIELSGTHWFGSKVQFDYAAHAVSGLKGDGADLDFVQSRAGGLYYVDNNRLPSFGGRASLTVRLSEKADATLGSSFIGGTLDSQDRLRYFIYGVDLAARIGKTTLRAEYLVRRQDLDVSDPSRFKYEIEPGATYFNKHGAYAEVEYQASKDVDLLGRVDGLYRSGNVLAASPLSARSAVLRYTAGVAYNLERGLRVKGSTEFWSFSDADALGRHNAVSFHLGLVGAF
jgi:hypothetical protein